MRKISTSLERSRLGMTGQVSLEYSDLDEFLEEF